jgi:hypothetical protein
MSSTEEIIRRIAICEKCPEHRRSNDGMTHWCNRECDVDNPSSDKRVAPSQFIKRLSGDSSACGRWVSASGRVVFPPYIGEFGWMLMTYARYVNWFVADEKVVCCRASQECLFPSASAFFTDWENPIPEAFRQGHTNCRDWGAHDRFQTQLLPVLQAKFPGYDIVTPTYDCHWHMSDGQGFKFHPMAQHRLPAVDIVIGPRRRAYEEIRNWEQWPAFASVIKERGLKLGVVGMLETSYECAADACAWDHPEGDNAGSIDLLSHCRLFIGIDSGMAHLAALLDVPSILLPSLSAHNQFGVLQRANKSFFLKLDDSAWHDLTVVVAAASGYLAGNLLRPSASHCV